MEGVVIYVAKSKELNSINKSTNFKDKLSTMTKNMNLSKLPNTLVTVFMIISTFLWLKAWINLAALLYYGYSGQSISLPFLGGPTVSLIYVILTTIIFCFGWLLSTRVNFYKRKRTRGFVFMCLVTYFIGIISWYGMSRIYLYFIPFIERNLLTTGGSDVLVSDFIYQLALTQQQELYFLLFLAPVIVVGFVAYFFLTKYHVYDRDLKEAFAEFEWNGKWLQKFAKLENKEYLPDIELGADVKTNEMVTLYGYDRTLNTNITGAIGTGKSAALGLPIINQDLHHMTKFINEFEELYSREDYISEDVSGRYLNGISVIDPSNDLCKKVYQLAVAHNIPEESITYIDPTNENTISINPMRGPVDKVAEVFAQVISGLSAQQGGQDFFAQAQRNHLKQYIYLLKEHNPEEEVTFDMLIDMYNNTAVTREKHVKLKQRIPKNLRPEAFGSRDEYNYWQILKGIDEWFDLTLIPKKERSGDIEYDESGKMVYEDAEAEYVKGLRNILNDIAANPLIRRVLFGKSNFDFDRHLAVGGILLLNSAKGQLEELSKVLGKIVLMNLQNATFRREPNVSTYHHILVDEAPEYLYPAFKSFPSQSRKYKVTITILEQTLAQLSDEYGENFKTILLASLRNKMFYGDLTGTDAKEFSDIAGEKLTFKEGENEQEVSAIQEDPNNRSGASYQKSLEQAYTANQLIYQDAFNCAVKIVVKNKPMPVRIIKANFVPKEEFKVAKYQVDDEAAAYWLEVRQQFGKQYLTVHEAGTISIDSIEVLEEKEQELLEELGLVATAETEQREPNVKVKYQRDEMVEPVHAEEVDSKGDDIISLMSQVAEKETVEELIEQAPTSDVIEEPEDVSEAGDEPITVSNIGTLDSIMEEYIEPKTTEYQESTPSEEQNAELEKVFGITHNK